MRLSQRSAARRERLVTAVISIFAGVGALALASVFLSFFAAWGDMSAGTVKAMSGAAPSYPPTAGAGKDFSRGLSAVQPCSA